ncbi:MAG: AAA family ATPase [Pseudomonadota bacterium]
MNFDVDAIEIRNFRGIDVQGQKIMGLGRLNLFIGSNNSGKSTVLRLISHYFPAVSDRSKVDFKNSFDELDQHRPAKGNPIVGLGFEADKLVRKILDGVSVAGDSAWPNDVRVVIDILADDDGIVWWDYDLRARQPPALRFPDAESYQTSSQSARPFDVFMRKGSPYSGGGPEAWVKHSLEVIKRFPLEFDTPTHLIPAVRKISESNIGFEDRDLSGNGLVNRLAELQNPILEQREDVRSSKR